MISKTCFTMRLLLGVTFFLCFQSAAFASGAVGIVRSVISAPEEDLSYERAKLAFDLVIEQDQSETAVKAKLEELADAADRIAANGNDIDKLKAV